MLKCEPMRARTTATCRDITEEDTDNQVDPIQCRMRRGSCCVTGAARGYIGHNYTWAVLV